MLAIDISALSQAELRQLLAVARERDQRALVEQLTAELNARLARRGQWEAPQRLTIPPPAKAPPPPRRRSLAVALSAGAAGVMVAALAWGVSVPSGPLLMTPLEVDAPRAAMAIATPIQATMPTALLPEPPIAAPAVVAAPVAAPAVVEPATAAPQPAAHHGHNPCYELPTPADRLVCGYPSLGDRERRLRGAYQAAVSAGGDPQALEAEQAAWKAERDGVSDRATLADLYDKRIRELTETTQ